MSFAVLALICIGLVALARLIEMPSWLYAIVCIFVCGMLWMYQTYHPAPETISERIGADIWTDPETRCQYFLHDGVGGTRQPRLNRDGKPYCGSQNETNTR